MLVGACVDWIGFMRPFSGLVRGLGVSCGWLEMVDCRRMHDSLESSGFVVLPWLVVGCRSVLVWTGSDFVVWFPIQSA